MAKIKINKLPAGYSLVDGKIVQQEQSQMKSGGPIKGKFTRNTKRQEKRAAEGKKGRYIKEGPLTVEESRLLDERYPYTSSDMPILMLPNDFYDADFGYITGPERPQRLLPLTPYAHPLDHHGRLHLQRRLQRRLRPGQYQTRHQ